MSMIEIQEAYIVRVSIAASKVGKRSAGLMFARTKRAARKDATRALVKIGYPADSCTQIIQDAYDMYVLERDAV